MRRTWNIQWVKLGGSLITEKSRAETSRPQVIARLCGEIAQIWEEDRGRLLIGHGSGSFGHLSAQRTGVHRGLISGGRIAGIAETQNRAAALHHEVMKALLAAGVAPFSLAPSSFMMTAEGRPSRLSVEPLVLALRLGLLPTVYGDVTLDRRQGVAIASTETVFRALMPHLRRWGMKTTRVVWCGATAGVLDERGELIPRLEAGRRKALPAAAGRAAGWDVTGGMRHRVETAFALARSGITSLIVDGRVPGLLQRALQGEEVPGTLIEGKG